MIAGIRGKLRNRRLTLLLQKAAAELRLKGRRDIPYTDFSTTLDFAEFLEQAAGRIKSGDISDGEKLWQLFAPTCDWDNAGGSLKLGNLIFAAANSHFAPTE